MLRNRIIPILLLRDQSLVKTNRFGKYTYVGDPCNTVRIFNELEVDELFFLDINVSVKNQHPDLNILKDIADECFMPLGYGGGIRSLEDAKKIFDIGFEKVALNTQALENPGLITEIARHYGSQAVIVSIDVKKSFLSTEKVWSYGGKRNTNMHPVQWAKQAEALGAGEILITSIDREGTWSGFDLELIAAISSSVHVPVVAHGGGGCKQDIQDAIEIGGASAVGVGSMVVYHKKNNGVLINMGAVSQ